MRIGEETLNAAVLIYPRSGFSSTRACSRRFACQDFDEFKVTFALAATEAQIR